MPPEPPKPGDILQVLGNEPYLPGPTATHGTTSNCWSEEGTEQEMQARCNAEPDCTLLLNLTASGGAWKACRSVAFDKSGPVETKLKQPPPGMDKNNNPTWRTLLLSDMRSQEAVSGGISGVRCAIGSANQVRDEDDC